MIDVALRVGQSLLRITGALAAVFGLILAAILVFTTMPGSSHRGALPVASAAQQALAQQLQRHVAVIAAQEHNAQHPAALEAVATYLESELVSYGYQVRRDEFKARGVAVRNLEVTVPSQSAPGRRLVVIGAHYDHLGEGDPGCLPANRGRTHPGADDNAHEQRCSRELRDRFSGKFCHLGQPFLHRRLSMFYTSEHRHPSMFTESSLMNLLTLTPVDVSSCAPEGLGARIERPQAEQLATLLKAIADPTRLQLISYINASNNAEACVCNLTEPLALSQPTVSHHLKVLAEAGLIEREKRGTWVWYSVNQERWQQLAKLFEV